MRSNPLPRDRKFIGKLRYGFGTVPGKIAQQLTARRIGKGSKDLFVVRGHFPSTYLAKLGIFSAQPPTLSAKRLARTSSGSASKPVSCTVTRVPSGTVSSVNTTRVLIGLGVAICQR